MRVCAAGGRRGRVPGDARAGRRAHLPAAGGALARRAAAQRAALARRAGTHVHTRIREKESETT